ncbi:MAG: Lon protease family protein [Desulfovibrionaceae bacterium]
MPKVKPLPAKRLRAALVPTAVPYEDSRAIPLDRIPATPQPRALHALELGLCIKDGGYNIFVAGEPNLGRTYLVRDYLAPRAAKAPAPKDIVYVFHFDNPDRPNVLLLPAGQGKRLKTDLGHALTRLRREIPARFDQDGYIKKRNELIDTYQTARDALLGHMEDEAAEQGFNLNVDDQGALTLYPLIEGKLLGEEEFERLDPELRKTLKAKGDRLMKVMSGYLREVTQEERGFREKERTLDLEIMNEVLAECFDPVAATLAKAGGEALAAYLDAVRADIVESLDQFAPREAAPGQPQGAEQALQMLGGAPPADDYFIRYEINLFVDNAETKGAPIVLEDHPTPANLLGSIEREAEMGALITDFTLVKAGALHRANGGFLILHVEDILQYPPAWEGLLRALRSGSARIEDVGEGADQPARTKTIEPEPIPLSVKVVLIGTDETYEMFLSHEDRFPKLFKLKAHLRETVDRNAQTVRALLARLARVIHEADLRPFGRDALAGLVDYASRLCEDQKKLSLKMPLVRELMIEASAMAGMAGRDMVDAAVLAQAMQARDFRANLYEEEFMEEYDREVIKVATSGAVVGRVNGLSVTWLGDYEFGLPHQIACTVGVGHGGIIDLEREAEMGGPIHTKGMMILKSYLISLFAQDKPIVLTGSLCFEQSYAQVEGDSASGAELAALLSALGNAPISLSLAFTGAVNHSGAIMAVGGVSRKVEGFFEVCSRKGLTGEQGVLLPVDVVDHLMLKKDVVDAVEAGMFSIYPVRHMDQAMELLTGLPAGRRLKNGRYSSGSLYRRVDDRLAELAELADKPAKRRK